MKIVFGKTRDEVVRGLELCRLSLEKRTAEDELVAKAFHELHDRLGVERLERIDAEAVRTLAANGCDHALYFELNGDPLLVPLRSLRPTKPPASQPDSVLAARACMAEAAAGLRPRRPPIDVRPLEGEVYEIVDGNATCGVALEARWPNLPVSVV